MVRSESEYYYEDENDFLSANQELSGNYYWSNVGEEENIGNQLKLAKGKLGKSSTMKKCLKEVKKPFVVYASQSNEKCQLADYQRTARYSSQPISVEGNVKFDETAFFSADFASLNSTYEKVHNGEATENPLDFFSEGFFAAEPFPKQVTEISTNIVSSTESTGFNSSKSSSFCSTTVPEVQVKSKRTTAATPAFSLNDLAYEKNVRLPEEEPFDFASFADFPEEIGTNSFHCTASTIHQPTTTEEHKRRQSTKHVKRSTVHNNTGFYVTDFLDDSNKDVHGSCKAFDTLFPDVPHVTDYSNSTPANSNCASFRKKSIGKLDILTTEEWWDIPPSSDCPIDFILKSDSRSLEKNQGEILDFFSSVDSLPLESELGPKNIPDSHHLSKTVSKSFDSFESDTWQAFSDPLDFNFSGACRSPAESTRKKERVTLQPNCHDIRVAASSSRRNALSRIKSKNNNIRMSKEASKVSTGTENKLAGESVQEIRETEQPPGILSLADIGELDTFRSTLSDNQDFSPDYHRLVPVVSSSLDSSDEETEKTGKTALQDVSTSESSESRNQRFSSNTEARIRQRGDDDSIKSHSGSSIICNKCCSPSLSEKTSEYLNCVRYHLHRRSQSTSELSTESHLDLKKEWISIPDNVFVKLSTRRSRDSGVREYDSEFSDEDSISNLRNIQPDHHSLHSRKKTGKDIKSIPQRAEKAKIILQPSSHDTATLDTRRSKVFKNNSTQRSHTIPEAIQQKTLDSLLCSKLASAYLLAKKENEDIRCGPTSDVLTNTNSESTQFTSTKIINASFTEDPAIEEAYEI